MNTTTLTEQIYEALGITETDIITGSGGYGTGFWHNELRIDLEDLKDGKLGAFRVIKDIHDTAGMSFREYHGVDVHVKLPDGVLPSSIVALCEGIFDSRESLTEGLTFEYRGTDLHAVWDSDGEYEHVDDAPGEWWTGSFREQVGDLTCREVYGLNYSENRPFVAEAIVLQLADVDTADKSNVLGVVRETYQDNAEYIFTDADEFTDWLYEWVGDHFDGDWTDALAQWGSGVSHADFC